MIKNKEYSELIQCSICKVNLGWGMCSPADTFFCDRCAELEMFPSKEKGGLSR